MVMSFITGDFFPGRREEVAGGKYFALLKPNASGAPIPNARGAPVDVDVQGIVISSTWRRCGASWAVTESSLAVADYLLGQYGNFFAVAWTQSRTRWKHRAVHPQGDQTHYDQHGLPIIVARFVRNESPHPSALQIAIAVDVLSGKASRTYDTGRVQVGAKLPRPRTLNKYWGWGIFCLCRAMPPLCVSVTIWESLITCPASRGGRKEMVYSSIPGSRNHGF